jgi:hypothetical protein
MLDLGWYKVRSLLFKNFVMYSCNEPLVQVGNQDAVTFCHAVEKTLLPMWLNDPDALAVTLKEALQKRNSWERQPPCGMDSLPTCLTSCICTRTYYIPNLIGLFNDPAFLDSVRPQQGAQEFESFRDREGESTVALTMASKQP